MIIILGTAHLRTTPSKHSTDKFKNRHHPLAASGGRCCYIKSRYSLSCFSLNVWYSEYDNVKSPKCVNAKFLKIIQRAPFVHFYFQKSFHFYTK